MKIIAGLGNPGSKYKKTRHNAGFIIIDKLLDDLQKNNYQFTSFKFSKNYNAEISAGNINKHKVLLVKPQTFMNDSGRSINSLIDFFKISPENNLIVIYDDIDLPLGEIRTTGISSGGHKGLQSIIDNLNTSNLSRLRIGILGKPKDKIGNTAQYVLKNFSQKEQKAINLISDKIFIEVMNFIKIK